ncbi:hypothetical protein F0562_023890 [Nyssa sinensis]|uniref:Reticulon-like protein n=1 Tax=Nyssa sinensis TaxID=561372 RepID=A0A5J5BJF4_9ASTE|nr:hypothetical protein F0562_023890 [Nyssa sinensis]
MPIDSSEEDTGSYPKLFGRERPIRDILGGGKVADVLLWKDKRVSAAFLFGISVIWFLFEVVKYNLVTLLSLIFLTTMLVIFIWCTTAQIFKWDAPRIPKIIIEESTFREAASIIHAKFNQFLSELLYIACGNDPKLFILAIASLCILSVIGTYTSSLNILFFGLLCLGTLPFLYERFENQVDYYAGRLNRGMRKMYKKFDSNVLAKIPRGPLKPKKTVLEKIPRGPVKEKKTVLEKLQRGPVKEKKTT